MTSWPEFQNGGFINEHNDSPAAMENEVCVDGKYQVNSKGKRNNKKKGGDNILKELCSAVRVLWATRQTEDIDKVKEADRYVKITLRELFVYIGFLLVLCIVSFGMISSESFIYSNVMISAFVSSTTSREPFISFQDVTHMNDIWKILQDPFLGNLYTSSIYDTLNAPNLTEYVANENYVLGVARLRQVRVRNDSCVIPKDFRNEIKECFSDWAPALEEKRPYGPYAAQNLTNMTAWFWKSERSLKGSSHQGLMNSYDGGGYVAVLSRDQTESNDTIQDLFNNLWIDRATRAVFVDLTVYNANINLFCQVRLVFEMPATGGVVPTYVIRPVKLIRYVSSFDFFVLICEMVFVAYIVYYIVEEILEIKKHKWSYFKAVWNILDVVIIFISAVCIAFNLYRYIKVNELLESLLVDNTQFIDFEFLCYWQTQYNNAVAGIIFISWIKIFKYVSFNKTMTQLSLTLSRCAKDVAGFAIMFFIVFLAYAQLGYLIFGTQVHDFSTFSYSIFTLFRIILGDFDFEAIETANRVLGPIFFLTYVFFVFFVLLNMFIAIINDTYGEIKSELAGQKSEIELGAFFKKGYNRVLDKLNVKRAQIIDIQKAITTADINQDNRIDYIEFRNNLREKGYSDVEIEALFAKYDLDGDRCLNEEEQKGMLKDLMTQNEELKEAYMLLEKAQADREADEERRKKRTDGVLFEDYSMLSSRIDRMEGSIGSIVGKVDSVLNKLDAEEAARKEALKFDSEKSGISLGNKKGGSNQSFA